MHQIMQLFYVQSHIMIRITIMIIIHYCTLVTDQVQ